MSEDVESILKLYEGLKSGRYLIATTSVGRDGRIIGVVTDPKSSTVHRGVVMLFSNPPSAASVEVACVDYEERQSQQGKTYVKCFSWVPTKELNNLIKELELKLVKERINTITSQLPEKYREPIKKFLETGEAPVLTNAVIFYGGTIPIATPYDEAYLVIVERSGSVHKTTPNVWGETKIISPPNAFVLKLNQYESIPEIPQTQIVSVGGSDFLITWNSKVGKALKTLMELPLTDELKRKILYKISKKLEEEESPKSVGVKV